MATRVRKVVQETVADAEKQIKKTVEQVTTEAERSPLLEAARKVLLAGIGAVALAQEEIEDFVNKLVERGEIAEADGKKLLSDVVERRKKDAKRAENELDKRVEDVLARMNIPTKSEIEALGAKITALTRKVEELKKSEGTK
jgi:poly(hydroxyalkanoate) granule-associated protein